MPQSDNDGYEKAIQQFKVKQKIERLSKQLDDKVTSRYHPSPIEPAITNTAHSATATPTLINDPIVEKVRKQLLLRSNTGIRKYGVTLARTDLSIVNWIDHAIEEALDLVLYLTKLREELQDDE